MSINSSCSASRFQYFDLIYPPDVCIRFQWFFEIAKYIKCDQENIYRKTVIHALLFVSLALNIFLFSFACFSMCAICTFNWSAQMFPFYNHIKNYCAHVTFKIDSEARIRLPQILHLLQWKSFEITTQHLKKFTVYMCNIYLWGITLKGYGSGWSDGRVMIQL